MTKKPALGKGLSALISDAKDIQGRSEKSPADQKATSPLSISEILVEDIEPNPFQPRLNFDEAALTELSESIKTLGLIQPITVRRTENGRYQIISGERRFRAASMAGLTHIPAYVRRADDQGMLEMAIVENIQREDLDAIEIALSFKRLIEECNLTQERMAERVGKGRTTVTNYLRLLNLPAEIQLAIRAGKVSMGHAKALLAIDDVEVQLDLCNTLIENELSVRELEESTKKLKNKEHQPRKKSSGTIQDLPDSYYRLLEFFGKYFNNNISLKTPDAGRGKGTITIHFSNDSEIESLLEALDKSNL